VARPALASVGRLNSPGEEQEKIMIKVAVVLWIIGGATLAGMMMVAVLVVPSLSEQAMHWIPIAVGCGFVIAMPISFLVARKIASPSVR
jgi:putative flippase GtrA